eukprot:gb/GEZN01009653.1/.p1 GENE.gb/GEZN01009653.1/~~gb/GEZN01009653.1/.p1  ORF type:complete len:298 (-),score=30.23 gb/GEZN01009653.1/:356-1249(-)
MFSIVIYLFAPSVFSELIICKSDKECTYAGSGGNFTCDHNHGDCFCGNSETCVCDGNEGNCNCMNAINCYCTINNGDCCFRAAASQTVFPDYHNGLSYSTDNGVCAKKFPAYLAFFTPLSSLLLLAGCIYLVYRHRKNSRSSVADLYAPLTGGPQEKSGRKGSVKRNPHQSYLPPATKKFQPPRPKRTTPTSFLPTSIAPPPPLATSLHLTTAAPKSAAPPVSTASKSPYGFHMGAGYGGLMELPPSGEENSERGEGRGTGLLGEIEDGEQSDTDGGSSFPLEPGRSGAARHNPRTR